MNYGLYISAAGLQAQDARQSVISNNLANSMTTGFKRDLAVMRSRANAVVEDPHMRPYRVPVVDHQGGGVSIVGGGIDLSQSSLDTTGNATDLALEGKGFFTVAGPDSTDRLLTRNGKFIIADEGR